MANVVVLGGCIVDLISYASRFPHPGETMAGHMFCKGFGGKGANQAVMADRLGTSTALIAKLGNDAFGREYLQTLKESNILSDFVTVTNEAGTSTASICVTDEGQNSIIYVPGAIMNLSVDDVRKAESLIANSKILVCTYEAPLDALLEALTIARKYKVLTLVNAAPTSSGYESLYPLIDIICLNEVEAEQSTGITIASINDAGKASLALTKKGMTTVLTLGAKGAIFQHKDELNSTHVPARLVKAVDSTGAGDAFMGSLAYYLSNCPGLSLEKIIRNSCEIATMSVLKHGTQSSFPYIKDVPKHLLV